MSFTKDDIIAALKMVFDPEIPVNVWDLGLIYEIEERSLTRSKSAQVRAKVGLKLKDKSSNADNSEPISDNLPALCALQPSVLIKMTLTSPTCPMAEEIVQMVRQSAESVAGRGNVSVELIWYPPWSLDRMSQQARIELDLTGEGW